MTNTVNSPKNAVFFDHKLNSYTHVHNMLICISHAESLRPFPEGRKAQIFWQMLIFGHFILEKEMNKS